MRGAEPVLPLAVQNAVPAWPLLVGAGVLGGWVVLLSLATARSATRATVREKQVRWLIADLNRLRESGEL